MFFLFTGTAFFVLGENVDVYSNGDHTHQAFMKIGLEFTKCLKALVSSTLVSDNASTQRYREFVETTNTMRQQGRVKLTSSCMYSLNSCHCKLLGVDWFTI